MPVSTTTSALTSKIARIWRQCQCFSRLLLYFSAAFQSSILRMRLVPFMQFIRWSCVLAFSFRYTYSLDHSCGGTNQLEWINLVYAQTLQVRCRHCQVQQCDLNCVTEHISPVPDLVPSTCTIAAHLLHYWRFWWATWLCIAQVGVVLGLCIRNLATCWMSQRGASYESWHAFFAEQCKIPCINLCSLVFCNLLHSGLWISKALETTMQLLVRFLFFSLVFCTSK